MTTLHHSFLVCIVIVIGSVLGSIKSSLDGKPLRKRTRVINFLMGTYCGISVAYYYQDQFGVSLLALVALVASMNGTNILEVLGETLPSITKKWLYSKVHLEETNDVLHSIPEIKRETLSSPSEAESCCGESDSTIEY